ncbi:hypothetical protein AB0I10_10555 [Streptomyces sp. NPDC050636]|uniref:LppU/SCO3897 family protein n=1 Tax=Streptomyces sp. NPDC050636 TaxID=3154510 RepID=UPI0034308A1C
MAILKVIGLIIAVIFAGVIWVMSWDDADTAEVGDCLKNNGNTINPDLQVVDCGTSEAKYKVKEVHPDTTDTTLCSPGTTPYGEQQRSRRGSGKKFVLCLTDVK